MTSVVNPFSNFGKTISGERFIGRGKSLRLIRARVTEADQPGNLAIIGEPRIGKSSLAHQGIMMLRQELLERRVVAIRLSIGYYKSGWALFLNLVNQVGKALEEQRWLTPSIDRLWTQLRQATALTEQSQCDVQSFFDKVRAAGVKILAVLDEFDHARTILAGDKTGFELLREISYDADTSVTLITLSRRNIAEIQVQSGIISTFSGTFESHYIRPFDEQEVEEYFSRLESVGLPLGEHEKSVILDYTGAHPFFLDIVAFYLFENRVDGVLTPIEDFCEEVAGKFLEEHKRLVSLLNEDGTANKLVQILYGPVFDVQQEDITRLTQYGIIREENDHYVAYSKHFQNYMRGVARSFNVWPLWRDTEQGIRRVVRQYLLDTYGDDWPVKLKAARPKWEGIINRWESLRADEKRKDWLHASDDLLDYSYPAELFVIISSNWSWFGKLFPNQVDYWKRPFEVMARTRAPLAHNRPLDRGLLNEVTGICEQVLVHISNWEGNYLDKGVLKTL